LSIVPLPTGRIDRLHDLGSIRSDVVAIQCAAADRVSGTNSRFRRFDVNGRRAGYCTDDTGSRQPAGEAQR
jgi:hypothetical protein